MASMRSSTTRTTPRRSGEVGHRVRCHCSDRAAVSQDASSLRRGLSAETVQLAGLGSERSQTLTHTIDDVAAEATGKESVEPAFDEQSLANQLVGRDRRFDNTSRSALRS